MMTTTARHARSDGVDIAFDDIGRGEPALVLIHPAFSGRTHYAAIADRLAEHHRVISLDLRGHGESGVPREGFTIAGFARDVLAACRAAGVDRAVYCGHSMGAAVALTAAVLDPERAAGVAMLDGAILFPEPLRRGTLESFVPALEGPNWLAALRGYWSERMFGPYDPPDVRARVLAELDRIPPHLPAQLFRDIFGGDFADVVRDAACPLLYIHARIPADLDRLRELRPDVLIATTVGSGHFVALVVPEQIIAMLERFLSILPLVQTEGANTREGD